MSLRAWVVLLAILTILVVIGLVVHKVTKHIELPPTDESDWL